MTDTIVPVLTLEQESAMREAQDHAARAFWAYPNDEWQIAFQTHWLQQTGLSETGRAITQSGRAVGAFDE